MNSQNNKRIKTIWSFSKKYIAFFIIAEICIAVSYSVSVILPLNFSKLIDEVFTGGKYYMFPEIIWNYICLFALSTVFNFIYAFVWQYLSNHYLVDIKVKMFKTVITSKARTLANMNSGDTISRIDDDSNQMLHVIQRNIFHFVNSIFMCLSIILIVGSMNYIIAIMLILAAGLPIVLTRICKKHKEKYAKESRKIMGNMTGRLFEIIKGFREIKLANAAKWSLKQLLEPLSRDIQLGNIQRRIDFIVNKGTYLINLSISIAVYWYSVSLVHSGLLTVGNLLLIINYTALLHRKFNWILRIYLDWFSRRVSIDRVIEVLNNETETSEGKSIDKIAEIKFDNIGFSYDGKEKVLNKVSFKIDSGEKAGIVGKSGVGKTTVISLLLKLYSPDNGNIYINNLPIDEISPASLRSKIGVVSQDIILFEDSVKYNLNFGCEHSDTDIWNALSAVNMKETVKNLPNGLDTVISADSTNLSGGQKQRIMIARLILKKPDLIILDEATSALDIETEKSITEYLCNIGYTSMLIISHRLETIKTCDKIAVLENAEVACIGTANDLYDNSPVYRGLFGGTR